MANNILLKFSFIILLCAISSINARPNDNFTEVYTTQELEGVSPNNPEQNSTKFNASSTQRKLPTTIKVNRASIPSIKTIPTTMKPKATSAPSTDRSNNNASTDLKAQCQSFFPFLTTEPKAYYLNQSGGVNCTIFIHPNTDNIRTFLQISGSSLLPRDCEVSILKFQPYGWVTVKTFNYNHHFHYVNTFDDRHAMLSIRGEKCGYPNVLNFLYDRKCSGFTCNNKLTCIPSSQRCDHAKQCSDNSDEINCPAYTCPSGYVNPDRIHKCANTSPTICIGEPQVCDGVNDCPGGSEEKSCGNCRPTEHKCTTTGRCIHRSQVCNGANDCGDWSEESYCAYHCGGYKCFMSKKCIPQSYQCNGKKDCYDSSDEQFCTNATQPCTGIKCMASGKLHCLPSGLVCNGNFDCDSGSDEIGCPTDHHKVCPEMTCDDGRCYTFSDHCDGYNDCPDGSDERGCPNIPPIIPPVIPSVCPELTCDDGGCYTYADQCDDWNDCLDGSDEDDCYVISTGGYWGIGSGSFFVICLASIGFRVYYRRRITRVTTTSVRSNVQPQRMSNTTVVASANVIPAGTTKITRNY